ncbi:MAG: hypothetical protein V4550_18390 [Gemmatimonadota bacterium]
MGRLYVQGGAGWVDTNIVTTTMAGFMSAADKIKLDSLSPGGGGTLAQTYASGVSAADSTMLLNAAAGPVILKDNAAPIGTMLALQTSAGVNLYSFSPTNLTMAVGTSILGVSSQGTLNIGPALTGSDATDTQWLNFQPTEAGSVPWVHWFGQFNNATWARKNQVSRFGWNVAAGGGLIITGTNIGGWSSEFETSFEGAPYGRQSERHEVFWHPDGVATRIWSCLSSLIAPYVSTLFISAETINVGPGGGGTVGITPTTAGMNSPSGLNTHYVDDSQAWIKANSGGAAVTVLSSGEVDVSCNTNFTVNVDADNSGSGTGFLKAAGTTVWEWGAGFMAGFADFLQIGTDSSGGNPTQPSPRIRWRGSYFSGGSPTRYDADIQHIVDSTTPTGHFSFQFNETPVADLNQAGALLLYGVAAAAFIDMTDGSNAAVSAAGHGRIRYIAASKHFEASVDGGAYTVFGP